MAIRGLSVISSSCLVSWTKKLAFLFCCLTPNPKAAGPTFCELNPPKLHHIFPLYKLIVSGVCYSDESRMTHWSPLFFLWLCSVSAVTLKLYLPFLGDLSSSTPHPQLEHTLEGFRLSGGVREDSSMCMLCVWHKLVWGWGGSMARGRAWNSLEERPLARSHA